MNWRRGLSLLLPALLVCGWSYAAELESSDAEAVIASSDQFATAPAWIALSKDAEDAGLNDGLWTITYELTPKGKALFADLTVRSKAYVVLPKTAERRFVAVSGITDEYLGTG